MLLRKEQSLCRMGQSSSSEASTVAESHTRKQIESLFQTRASQLLTAPELAALHRKLPENIAQQGEISPSALISLLGLGSLADLDCTARSLELLYQIFVRLAALPFLEPDSSHDKGPITPENEKEGFSALPSQGSSALSSQSIDPGLSVRGFFVAVAVHMHRLTTIWKHADYVALLFWALLPDGEGTEETEREKEEKRELEKTAERENARVAGHYIVQALQVSGTQNDDAAGAAKRIDWNTLETLPDLDADSPACFGGRSVAAEDLRCVFTLMLVADSLVQSPQSSEPSRMSDVQWRAFEAAASALVKHFSASARVSLPQFRRGMRLTSQLQNTFRNLLQKQVFSETPQKAASSLFTPSRLVTDATVAQVSLMLGSDIVSQNVAVSRENLVELYNGSKSGFSIRSLESKIFKWHAPTLFFVAGKRVKAHNKRYEAFEAEYPRHFRSNEQSLQPGQSANDRLVYAVYMSEPWRVANKANFGNTDTVIVALQPRAEVFSSISSSVHQGRSVYFNTQGMGIGFGNEQPINKNQFRKYNPGAVSLTIEANLEYAVFRHISRPAASTPNFFHTASNPQAEGVCDYEDRFHISDLEVWGVGSTKELDEQKKNWEWEEKQAQARQSVNLRNMGEDRAFMEMVGLVGNHGSGGSV